MALAQSSAENRCANAAVWGRLRARLDATELRTDADAKLAVAAFKEAKCAGEPKADRSDLPCPNPRDQVRSPCCLECLATS